MTHNFGYIYQAARMATGITQEREAELINVSVKSVCDWESGKTIPTDDNVLQLVDVLNAPHLALQHMRNKSDLGRQCIPDFELKDLPTAVLRLLKEVNDFIPKKEELIDIASDGIITQEERVRFDTIMKELEDICRAYYTVKYSK
jgi:transcriptional regulator with XRE-family HTH domain